MSGKSLVVGATGSLGPSILKELRAQKQPIRLLVRDKSKAQKYFVNSSDIEIVQGNAGNKESIERALEGCSYLYYLINVPYPQWGEKAVPLFNASLEAAAKKNAKFIFPGNVYVYGLAQYNPVDESHPWDAHTRKGRIRIEIENILTKAKEEKGLTYTIVRMPDFYGPYVINGFSEKIYKQALKGKTIRWYGKPDTPIELIFVEDAGKAMVTAGLSDKANFEEFNIPGYSRITAKEYLEEVAEKAGKGAKVKINSSELYVALGGIFNPLAKEFKEMMYLKTEELILDGTKFKEKFGKIPVTPYEEGIRKTLEWAKNFYNL